MDTKLIQYKKRKRYKYNLQSDLQYATGIKVEKPIDWGVLKIDSDGLLTIKARYSWDGPSGPTFDTKSFMRGSLIHDALYQLLREGVLKLEQRKRADEILREICKKDGMFPLRAWWVYHGVRLFAAGAAKPDMLIAPK